MKNELKLIFTSLILLIIASTVCAQKLPNKQENSVYAPVNIKIDGRPREWNNQFNAYNHSTQVFYTLANDDDNLYLTIQAISHRIIEKIISGGISFVINDLAKSKKTVDITYPKLPIPIGYKIILNSGGTTSARPPYPGSNVVVDTLYKPMPIASDSLKGVANLQLVQNANTIGIKGIQEITDPEISIYNEYGIKAASAFDHSGAYTYELALPLKYIQKYMQMTAEGIGKIGYTIKVNTRVQEGKHFRTYYLDGVDIDIDLDTTTDFSGEYTLAKKP